MILTLNFSGFLLLVFVLAVPVSAIMAVIVRARYRKAVSRLMMARSGAPETEFDVPPPSHPNGTALEFDVAPMSRRPPLRLELAVRYFLSGVAFATVTAMIMLFIWDMELSNHVIFGIAAAFTLPALVMAFYVAGLRWYLVGLFAVFAGFLFHIYSPSIVSLARMLAVPACVLALIIGNPLLRTTAIPLFLIASVFLVVTYLAYHLVRVAEETGTLDFLLPFLSVQSVTFLYALFMAALIVVAGIVSTKAVARVVSLVTAGSSEFMMQHDLFWLLQALTVMVLMWPGNGPITLLFLLPFAAYRAVLWLTRPRGPAKEINLLLRVFGHRKRQTDLARSLLLGWRMDGPLLLIGSADLATETLDAPELAAFLNRRLSDIFIDTPQDLAQAAAVEDTRLGDGLFPVHDYYCRDNSWRPTVLTLMSRARRILVDMRGFREANSGIRYEIRALAERVPADRIVVIVEADAMEGIQALFSQAWAEVGTGSGTDRIAFRVDGAA